MEQEGQQKVVGRLKQDVSIRLRSVLTRTSCWGNPTTKNEVELKQMFFSVRNSLT